jgi:DNA-binding winged helix-turn-helix (wHTH) protein/TolB-like protein
MESGRFRFGLFEFNVEALELRREGVLVRLQSQPARVLACLVEHADQVVSREDLRRAVWNDDTFVDFDRGLNFCISQIRSALKDDSAEPTYVRTVPKSGYQFIAPIQRICGQSQESSTVEAGPGTLSIARTAALLLALAIVAGLSFLGYRRRSAPPLSQPPVLAVLRFDNETGDPGITRFSDGLTDNLVEQLTSQSRGRYRIIGNAQILRLPREQRDLKDVAASLQAAYVVLGQVQSNRTHVRILAHLIRLPDETHLWVSRIDRDLDDPLRLESDVAQTIAAEFAPRILADPSHAASLPSVRH